MGQPETIVSTVFTTLFVALVVVTNIPSAEMQECSAGQRLPTFQYVHFPVLSIFISRLKSFFIHSGFH